MDVRFLIREIEYRNDIMYILSILETKYSSSDIERHIRANLKNNFVDVVRNVHLTYGELYPHFNIRTSLGEIHIYIMYDSYGQVYYMGATVV